MLLISQPTSVISRPISPLEFLLNIWGAAPISRADGILFCAEISHNGLWYLARLSIRCELSFAKCCMLADCSWKQRRAAFIVCLSLTFLFLCSAPNSEACLAKSLPAMCCGAHTYTENTTVVIFFGIISLQEKRCGMQARICNSSRRAGYIGERHALLYIIVVCAIPSADMRYLITLTPSGNKNKEKSADTRAWASELRPGSMNMQETPC